MDGDEFWKQEQKVGEEVVGSRQHSDGLREGAEDSAG